WASRPRSSSWTPAATPSSSRRSRTRPGCSPGRRDARGSDPRPGPHARRSSAAVTTDAVTADQEEGSYLLLLKDTADAVAGTTSLAEALEATVDLLAERLGFDVCSIYLTDDAGTLVLEATHGLQPESVGRVRMRPSEGLT